MMIGERCTINALSIDGDEFGDGVSVGRGTVIESTGCLRHIENGYIGGDNVGLGADCYYGCAGGIEIASDTIKVIL